MAIADGRAEALAEREDEVVEGGREGRLGDRGRAVPQGEAPGRRHRQLDVGEPVAVVCAADRYAAEDALDHIRVAYRPLPGVVDPVKATSHTVADSVFDTTPMEGTARCGRDG